jgi:membrane protease YdiL (CAAX protease family)
MEQIQYTHAQKELAYAQIFFIFIFPVALLIFGVIPVSWRMLMLCSSMLLMYGIIAHEKMSDAACGITKKNLLHSIFAYSVFILLGIGVLEFLSDFWDLNGVSVWYKSPHLLFLFLPVSLLQEIAYRGFLFPKLAVITHKKWVLILLNTILFTLIHTIYPRPEVMVPFAFVIGLAFALMYDRYPNLILISIAHSVLNFYAILHGFFYFTK